MSDLKGLNIFDETFVFPGGDTFEAIVFTHSELYHSTFTNAVFNCSIGFAKMYNCEFRRCIFSFNHCYGATFEKTRFLKCDFVEHNTFTNCSLRGVSFERCFMPERVFFDCSFDQTTRVGNSVLSPHRMNAESFKVDPKNAAEIFHGIREAYRAGDVPARATHASRFTHGTLRSWRSQDGTACRGRQAFVPSLAQPGGSVVDRECLAGGRTGYDSFNEDRVWARSTQICPHLRQ